MAKNRVVFDIETEPFNDAFFNSKTSHSKKKNAPEMRVACLFSEKEKTYYFFEPHEAHLLIKKIQEADEVITFNGKGFDLLVLRKHYGLIGKAPFKGVHIDIHEVMTKRAGFRVSLDKAAKLNLNEGKHTHGRAMSSLDISNLKEACQSDVSQTYRLWLAYTKNQLACPVRSISQRFKIQDDDFSSIGQFMPDYCPCCNDIGSLEFIDSEEEMTEGQLAEYLAGTQGLAICQTCNAIIDWYA